MVIKCKFLFICWFVSFLRYYFVVCRVYVAFAVNFIKVQKRIFFNVKRHETAIESE